MYLEDAAILQSTFWCAIPQFFCGTLWELFSVQMKILSYVDDGYT